MARKRNSRKTRTNGLARLGKPNGIIQPRVQEAGPQRFGIVAIDCAKARSKWMLCDFYGNVLVPPTEVGHAVGVPIGNFRHRVVDHPQVAAVGLDELPGQEPRRLDRQGRGGLRHVFRLKLRRGPPSAVSGRQQAAVFQMFQQQPALRSVLVFHYIPRVEC